MPLSPDDPFCVQPWYGQEISLKTTETCCWMQPGADVEHVKKEMIAGRKPSACSKCWKAEDKGIESRRQQQNMMLDVHADLDIKNIKNNAISGNAKVSAYQLFISNICNGSCVTCSSQFSSQWGSLTGKGKYTVKETDIDYENAVSINIVGGEPFLEKKTKEVFENLINNNNTDCFVSITTNGSITPDPHYIELMRTFPKLSICMSIDGVGKVFDYMRYPLKWDVVSRNVDLFKSIAKYVSVSYTESNVNRIYRDETLQWFRDNDLPFIDNQVEYPAHFAGEHPTSTTIVQLDWQDKLKGIDRKDYIPEWEEKYGNIH